MEIRLFCSDLDGTLLGDSGATLRFTTWWNRLPEGRRPILVYNSGRHMDNLMSFASSVLLPGPAFLIGAMGTELYDCGAGRMMDELQDEFDPDWDLHAVRRILSSLPGVSPQEPWNCNAWKSSWYVTGRQERLVAGIRRLLKDEGLRVQIVFSHGGDLDILPRGVNKGSTLAWLCGRLGVPLETVVVAGNSANDADMFRVPGVRGIAVADSHDDLLDEIRNASVYHAASAEADGVIEGLEHYGLKA